MYLKPWIYSVLNRLTCNVTATGDSVSDVSGYSIVQFQARQFFFKGGECSIATYITIQASCYMRVVQHWPWIQIQSIQNKRMFLKQVLLVIAVNV